METRQLGYELVPIWEANIADDNLTSWLYTGPNWYLFKSRNRYTQINTNRGTLHENAGSDQSDTAYKPQNAKNHRQPLRTRREAGDSLGQTGLLH